MPPHIEVESHHHHDDLSGSGGGGSRNRTSSVEDSSPLFRDHLDDRTFISGASSSSSSSCRLDRRVSNPNYIDGKEMIETLNGDTTVDCSRQQVHRPATKPQQPPAAIGVSRIAAIIGPESAYYAKVCPNYEEGVVGMSRTAPSMPSSVVPTPTPSTTSSSIISASAVGSSTKPYPSRPPSTRSVTSTSPSSSSAATSASPLCEEKKRKSIFSRVTKHFRPSNWRVTHNNATNTKGSPPRQHHQQERNVI